MSMLLSFAFLGLLLPSSSVSALASEKSDLHILAVGINTYADDSHTLRYCVKDADVFASTLAKTAAQGSIPCPPPMVLLDKGATYHAIREAIFRIAKKASPRDHFVLFFSGQGGNSPKGPAILATDTQLAGAGNSTGLITPDTLADWIEAVQAQTHSIFLDTCSAGNFGDELRDRLHQKLSDLKGLTVRRVAVFAASTGDGFSWEFADVGHGLFTHCILQALTSSAWEGKVSLRTVEAALFSNMVSLSRTNSFQQYPATFFSGSFDYYLGRSATAPPAPLAIEVKDPAPSKSSHMNVTAGPVLFRFKLSGPITRCVVSGMEAKYEEEGWVAKIEVPEGESNVSVVATSVDGRKIEKTFRVVAAKNQPLESIQLGRRYALLIAVDKYEHWPPLSNPVRDAQALKTVLERDYGFAEAELLVNPTKVQIKEVLRKYRTQKFERNDQLLVFMTGHGHRLKDEPHGWFVPADARSLKEDPEGDTSISHADLRAMLDLDHCRQVLLILDSCFSGVFGGTDRSEGDQGLAGLLVALNPAPASQDVRTRARLINLNMKTRNCQYLTAGGDEYVSDGTPGRHSPFAAQLLKTLEEGKQQGLVTYSSLKSRMQWMHPIPRGGFFGRHSGAGDFVLVPKL